MPTSLQLANTEDKRNEAIAALAQAATDHELSYSISGDEFIVQLPSYEDVELPVIAKVDVPEDEEEVAGEYRMLAYYVEANLDETVQNYLEQGWQTNGPREWRGGKFCQAIVRMRAV